MKTAFEKFMLDAYGPTPTNNSYPEMMNYRHRRKLSLRAWKAATKKGTSP